MVEPARRQGIQVDLAHPAEVEVAGRGVHGVDPRADQHARALPRLPAAAVAAPAAEVHRGGGTEDVIPAADEERGRLHLVKVLRHPDRLPEAVPIRVREGALPGPDIGRPPGLDRSRIAQRQMPPQLAQLAGIEARR